MTDMTESIKLQAFKRQKDGSKLSVKISLCICVVLSWDELKGRQNLFVSEYEIYMVCLLVGTVYRHKSLQFVKKSNITLLSCRRCQACHVPQSFIGGDEWLRDVTSHHGFSHTTFLLYLTEIRICYWSGESHWKIFFREFHFESKKSWKREILSRLSSRGKMVAFSDTKTSHKFMINLWLVYSFSL